MRHGHRTIPATEYIPTPKSTGKRRCTLRIGKKSDAIESSTKQQFFQVDRMTEVGTTSTNDTCSAHLNLGAVESEVLSQCGPSEGPKSHYSVSETANRPSDGTCPFSKTGRRVYALRPRRKLRPSRSLSSAETVDNSDDCRAHSNTEARSVADVSTQPPVNLQNEFVEEIPGTSGRQPRPYSRRDSGVFAGRLKANPLRHLAALLRSKLLFHEKFCNLLELANEIHLEAKEKHNTTLRRIYDVVNVTEAAGLLERSIVSRSGKRKALKGSPLSGSLIRWRSPTTTVTDVRPTELVTVLHNRVLKKEEEFKELEEEVKLLENLLRHRKVRSALATSASISSTSASTQFCTREHDDMKSIPNHLLHSSALTGIEVPFCILKASRLSDDRNFEVYTCTESDECGTEIQVTISSAYEIQPYEWRWVLREMLQLKM